MTKFGRRLFLHISCIIVIVYVLSFLVNTYFLPVYFLHQKKSSLASIMQDIGQINVEQLVNDTEHLSYVHGVTIISVRDGSDVDHLNWALREQLSKRGIALSKFWVTEDTIRQLENGAIINKLYDQEKLKSSVLVSFMMKEDTVIAAAESIAHSSDTLRIVNQFNMWISIGALGFTLILAAWLSQRLVRPIEKLKQMTKDIANLKFRKVNIVTGDEVEELASSINEMSDKLQQAHQELAIRNENLRGFTADMSHELKTPIALIKAYTSGVKDGLDDGTYLDVIEKQADDMAAIVETLLDYSKLQVETYTYSAFDMRELVLRLLEPYRLAIQEHRIMLTVHIDANENFVVWADQSKMEIVWNNLIRNAISYTTNERIDIHMKRKGTIIACAIKNGIEAVNDEELSYIWEPFYVLEHSRSKQLSGTGLGLSIVKAILMKHQSNFNVQASNQEIEFYFTVETYIDNK